MEANPSSHFWIRPERSFQDAEEMLNREESSKQVGPSWRECVLCLVQWTVLCRLWALFVPSTVDTVCMPRRIADNLFWTIFEWTLDALWWIDLIITFLFTYKSNGGQEVPQDQIWKNAGTQTVSQRLLMGEVEIPANPLSATSGLLPSKFGVAVLFYWGTTTHVKARNRGEPRYSNLWLSSAFKAAPLLFLSYGAAMASLAFRARTLTRAMLERCYNLGFGVLQKDGCECTAIAVVEVIWASWFCFKYNYHC
eukprot:6317026-Amphidinium_carterae.1